jgi:hypothetical protein
MKWFISMMTLCASTREKTERYRVAKQEEIKTGEKDWRKKEQERREETDVVVWEVERRRMLLKVFGLGKAQTRRRTQTDQERTL